MVNPLTHLKIINIQQNPRFLIIFRLKLSKCYAVFNAFSFIIPINFPMNSYSQPWVLAALVPSTLGQSPFSVSSKRFKAAAQEMRMLLLFSRWVSGYAVIGLLCSECYMSSHYLSSVNANICFLTSQGNPFLFLSSLVRWVFKALTFRTFYFKSQREGQGDELSFLIKSLWYFYFT